MSVVSAELEEWGGHDIAAGATIPKSTTEEFTQKLDMFIGEQLRKKARST